ncbi:MAG: hydrogenase maturation protease [Gemmatimonadota bacterium]|nr:hydrogenase maturation protease [Gemmatimonadota bacterium]
MKRTLIAGFGNVLRGDDGFGVEVLRRLGERGIASDAVELLEVGTGGIRLAQELLTPFDRLIIIDATTRGGVPGSVYMLAIDDVRATLEIDLHTAVPSRALEVAKALGALPKEVYLIGCEPASTDELTMELSPVVAAAVDPALLEIERLLERSNSADTPLDASGDAAEAAGEGIAREDELLELLYWFEGEGFGGVAGIESITRFTALTEAVVRRTLDRLMTRGDVRLDTAAGEEYLLTDSGRREAARRFAAEFAPFLSQGHGECSDPDCDCHTSEGGAAECAGRAQRHSH